ncbi:hypothetical protein Vadar_008864 [Vaccinium darrowii]|uniref:Uncharacterized protein n=1 Tax=Vaccinium darrowii TaxID=229202 RepID=A0ACB7X8P7_9ERIC|nr:hypothetical protein Vadar_008864 [Vaccinium darrowii]
MFSVVQKLKNCKRALQAWGRAEFSNNVDRIKSLKLQLGQVQRLQFTQDNQERERRIKEELELTMLREEMRQRNQLSKLKDDNGTWISEDPDINAHLKGPPSSALKWTLNIVDSLSKDEANATLSLVAFTAWFIWKARNDFIFWHTPVNPLETLSKTNFSRSEFSNSLVIPSVHMDNHPINDVEFVWKALDCSSFKANCNVAIRPDSSRGMAVVVLRDWKGKVVDGVAKSLYVSSPFHGELFAIRAACLLMKALGLKGM